MQSAMNDRNKYNYMETTLQEINRKYISLPEDEEKRNKRVLEFILNKIITKMTEKDPLFAKLYERVFYGGSFYDKIRVGKPEEFDLDILMKLPILTKPELTNSDLPGFVRVKLNGLSTFQKQPEAAHYPRLERLLDQNQYLNTINVYSWMEGIIQRALNDFKEDDRIVIYTEQERFIINVKKSGPAFTLVLSGTINGKSVKMDIDLVPCFKFSADKWPNGRYRRNPVLTKVLQNYLNTGHVRHRKRERTIDTEFFIVPKKPNGNTTGLYWRLSFQEQERILIKDGRNLKPTIKLLKKLRDTLGHHNIASYYIKTMFLWKIYEDKTIFNNSLSYSFMSMLQYYHDCLEKKEILYFWNSRNNLLCNVNNIAIENMQNRIKLVIKKIESAPNDASVVTNFLITKLEKQITSPTEATNITENKTSEEVKPFTIENIIKVVEDMRILAQSIGHLFGFGQNTSQNRNS